MEPLKAFGVILFFIALGFDLPFLDGAAIVSGLSTGVVLTLYLVILTIPLMLFLGYVSKMKGRAATSQYTFTGLQNAPLPNNT